MRSADDARLGKDLCGKCAACCQWSRAESEGAETPNVNHALKTEMKWTLTALFNHLRERGHDTDTLWRALCDIVVKTVLAIAPKLRHIYGTAATPG